ncbi:MAG: HAMP domain-containing protein [Nitrospiraceae bacterium]|nr:MAG: HAMP domain-containing protein [Nitrospiraceae bacterium]
MTIKTKLILSSCLQTIMLLAIGITILFGYRYVSSQASTANAFDNQGKYLQMMLRGINEVIITEWTPQSVEIVQKGVKGFEELLPYVMEKAADEESQDAVISKIQPMWQEIKENAAPYLQDHSYDMDVDDLMIEYGRLITKADALINLVSKLSDSARAIVNSGSKKTEIIQYIIISVLAFILIAILVNSIKLYRSTMSPIKELTNIAEGFGDGNLNILMDEFRKDEFGILASHFNLATAKLSDFIAKLKGNIEILNENSKEVSDTASLIDLHAQKQSSQTSMAATAMEELSASFLHVTQNAGNAAHSAKEAAELAVKGGAVVTETIKGMNKIALSVHESARTIETLGNSSEQIGEIIQVINDIAGQTNLLALNAAIEAARAGEQGRGFAVVADEVRKLAEKTTASTNEIGNMINTIQEESNRAVKSMQIGTADVESGVELANQAGNSLKQIVDSVQNVTDMIQNIANAANEQSITGEEVASNIESVANITRKTAGDAQHSSSASRQLYAMVSEIQILANEFKLRNSKNDTIDELIENHPAG